MGITVAGTVRVHHGGSPGQGVLALVMVGNYKINAQLPAKLRFLKGGDAAVHGDDELDPLAPQLPDGNGI